MANCSTCGTKLGFGVSGVCVACRSRDEANAAAQLEAELAAQQADYDAAMTRELHQLIAQIDQSLQSQEAVYLYKTVYQEVDSMIEDQAPEIGLDLKQLNTDGMRGWEVVGVVPRTYSGSQSFISKNKVTATSWGGGSTTQRYSLSGNVVGAYFLMRLTVTAQNRVALDTAIHEVMMIQLAGELGPRPV